MKSSRFNVAIPLPDGTTLLFNTFSDSRVVLDKALLEAVTSCKHFEGLPAEHRKHLEELKALGFIVDDTTDEDRQLAYWFERIKHGTDTVYVTVLTTMACNMDCVYCFEQGAQSKGVMSEETVRDVCSWILERVTDVRPNDLTVTFFGGEPLLNLDAVYGISRALHEETSERGVTLNLELITNGLLLSKDVVATLLPFGLRWVKVTLDGSQPAHDRMRPRKRRRIEDGTSDTYEEIMKNLETVRGVVPLIVGGNYDDTTKDSIPSLLDDLLARGFLPEHFKKIAFKPILAFPGHKTASALEIEACTYAETNMDDFFWLITETEARGLPSYRKLGLGPCEAMRENTFTIDAVGNIYRCAAMAGRKEFSIGHIGDVMEDILFSPTNIAYMTADAWKQCGDCPYVPLCGGGCRLGAVSATGHFDAVACEREYFEKVTRRLVASELDVV